MKNIVTDNPLLGTVNPIVFSSAATVLFYVKFKPGVNLIKLLQV